MIKGWLKWPSIRTRLLVSYIGIFTVGFAIFAFVAGSQISSAARSDYEQRLLNEVRLVAQAVEPAIERYRADELTQDDLQMLLDNYSLQVNGTIALINLSNNPDGPRDTFHNTPELENALHGDLMVVERDGDNGERVLATALALFADDTVDWVDRQGALPNALPDDSSGALLDDAADDQSDISPVDRIDRSGGKPQSPPTVLLQISVPLANLQALIFQRWLVLWLVFIGLLLVAVFVSLWLAHTIIKPLVALRNSAVLLSQGDFSSRVNYHVDDEAGQVARAFNEMAEEVQSMLEEQRAFASNTSHELRTPLTTIRLRSEALRFDPSLDEETSQKYVEEIDDEVTRLGDLVQDLTLISRFDAGRAEFGHDEIDLVRLAGSVRQQEAYLAQEKQITVDVEAPDTPLVVYASLNHLVVVFRNLLNNALKYTPSDGQIIWTMKVAEGGVLNTIQDSGKGISSSDLPHVFERFYRADKSHARTVTGTGLGLSLVKSIVDAYGGRITIHSEGENAGTTVEVFWPTGQSQAVDEMENLKKTGG